MIVTADPLGDFNATSQILRYSALAREVTVPRIPSIAATILASPPLPSTRPPSPSHQHHPRPFIPAGSGSSGSYRTFSSDERATMELAALEIARLSDDMDQLRAELDYQTEARHTAEAHLLSMEDRLLDVEAAIREDCAEEFEQRLAMELARFKASLAMEQERSEEHWDRKVDVMERGLGPDEMSGAEDKENVLIENLEQEVERLRRDNAILKRELTNRSPSKRRPLEEREEYSQAASPSSATHNQLSSSPTKDPVGNIGRKLEKMLVSGGSNSSNSTKAKTGAKLRSSSATRKSTTTTATAAGSPKKMRRLGNKRWEDEDED